MMPLMFLCLLIGVPIFLALVFRVSAIFLFLSLAVGELLVRYLGEAVILAVNAFVRHESVPLIVRLVLLLGPVIMTLLILRKSLPRGKIFVQFIPLAFVGLAIASLTIPLLPMPLQQDILELPVGIVLVQSQSIIIAVAAVLSLLLAWRSHGLRDRRFGKRRK